MSEFYNKVLGGICQNHQYESKTKNYSRRCLIQFKDLRIKYQKAFIKISSISLDYDYKLRIDFAALGTSQKVLSQKMPKGMDADCSNSTLTSHTTGPSQFVIPATHS